MVSPTSRGFSAPRAADRYTQGGARGGAAKPGGDEPLPQRMLGATGPARECRAGEAGKPHDKAPRREGPFIRFGCRRAFH